MGLVKPRYTSFVFCMCYPGGVDVVSGAAPDVPEGSRGLNPLCQRDQFCKRSRGHIWVYKLLFPPSSHSQTLPPFFLRFLASLVFSVSFFSLHLLFSPPCPSPPSSPSPSCVSSSLSCLHLHHLLVSLLVFLILIHHLIHIYQQYIYTHHKPQGTGTRLQTKHAPNKHRWCPPPYTLLKAYLHSCPPT